MKEQFNPQIKEQLEPVKEELREKEAEEIKEELEAQAAEQRKEALQEEPSPEELELRIREEKERIKKEKETVKEEPEEKPKEEEIIKPKEVITLEKARENFARIDIDKGDFESYQKAKEDYLTVLKMDRVARYEKTVKELEKLGLPEKKADKEFKKKMEEIIKESVVREANRLYDLKNNLRLEAKGEPSKIEIIKNLAGQVVDKYRKMPLRYKLLITGGLLAGGLAAGAVGGASGAALITGLAAGRWFQRTLGGAATAVGLEALIKRSQEKKAEKETLAELSADKLTESIKNNDKKLDEKLFKLEGSKKKQKYWRYALAGSAGLLVGSGLATRGLSNVCGFVKDVWSGDEVEKMAEKAGGPPAPEVMTPDEAAGAEREAIIEGEKALAPVGEVSEANFIEIAEKGDSVWKMAEDQLEKHYGEKFTGLDQARKTYLIDAIKDKLAADPAKFGLEDVDKVAIGQKVDFSTIFEDKSAMEKIFERAGDLKQAAIENIEKNNQIIQEWVKEHPGQGLTSEKVEEILAAKEVAPAASVPEVMTPDEAIGAHYENRAIEVIGFNPEEYGAIKDLPVGKLLKEIPSKSQAWEMWRADQVPDLPHYGMYGHREFGRHIKLAEYIRELTKISSEARAWAEKMTISQFLRRIG